MDNAFGSYEAMRVPPEPAKPLVTINPRLTWCEPAPPRSWIVPGWFPRGYVTGFYGDGGIGKTLAAQLLMTCVAIGSPWFGIEVEHGRALGVFCEDDVDELQRRQEAINHSLGITMGDLENSASSLASVRTMRWSSSAPRGASLTRFHGDLTATAAGFNTDLLVLDTAADLYPDNENDRSKVRWFLQAGTGSIARDVGCGVSLLAHPSAAGLANGSGSGGSTAWNNTVRSRIYLRRDEGDGADPNTRILSRKKSNYAGLDGELRLVWRDGVLEVADEQAPPAGIQWLVITAMFDELDKAWRAGKPWSPSVQSKRAGRFFPSWARAHHGIPEKQVSKLLTEWIVNGCLSNDVFDTHSKSTGLRVLRRPDR
jgi:hypothetical protein